MKAEMILKTDGEKSTAGKAVLCVKVISAIQKINLQCIH